MTERPFGEDIGCAIDGEDTDSNFRAMLWLSYCRVLSCLQFIAKTANQTTVSPWLCLRPTMSTRRRKGKRARKRRITVKEAKDIASYLRTFFALNAKAQFVYYGEMDKRRDYCGVRSHSKDGTLDRKNAEKAINKARTAIAVIESKMANLDNDDIVPPQTKEQCLNHLTKIPARYFNAVRPPNIILILSQWDNVGVLQCLRLQSICLRL